MKVTIKGRSYYYNNKRISLATACEIEDKNFKIIVNTTKSIYTSDATIPTTYTRTEVVKINKIDYKIVNYGGIKELLIIDADGVYQSIDGIKGDKVKEFIDVLKVKFFEVDKIFVDNGKILW